VQVQTVRGQIVSQRCLRWTQVQGIRKSNKYHRQMKVARKLPDHQNVVPRASRHALSQTCHGFDTTFRPSIKKDRRLTGLAHHLSATKLDETTDTTPHFRWHCGLLLWDSVTNGLHNMWPSSVRWRNQVVHSDPTEQMRRCGACRRARYSDYDMPA